MEFSKVTVSMSTKTIEKLDEFSEDYGINRSAAVSMLVNLALAGIKSTQKVDLAKLSKNVRHELLFQLLSELGEMRAENIALILRDGKEFAEIETVFAKRIFEKILELGFEVKETEIEPNTQFPKARVYHEIKDVVAERSDSNEG